MAWTTPKTWSVGELLTEGVGGYAEDGGGFVEGHLATYCLMID